MKIGILTFHWATNHGALLQTYALQKVLGDLIPGSVVSIVDYQPAKYEMSLKKVLHCRNPKILLRNLRDYIKEKKLMSFRSGLVKTERYYSTEQLVEQPPDCDVFVVGSDQIWNQSYTIGGEGKPTAAYYLPFTSGARRISYAASFGTDSLRAETIEYILPFLREFDAISVREQTAKKILNSVGIPCQVVCDPSALLSQEEYIRLSQPAFSGKYIAKYFLRSENTLAANAIRHLKGDSKVCDVGLLPMNKWLGAIKEADFLLTNSFHGMMVALKLHVPFAVVLSEGTLAGMNDRFFTLLEKLGLSGRIVTPENTVEDIKRQNICWEQVDCVINTYAEESKAFIQENCR